MDEIDKEMVETLTPKQVKTFQQYQGVIMAREEPQTIEEQIRDVEWDFSKQKEKQWFSAKWYFIIMEAFLWSLVVIASFVYSNGLVISGIVVISLVVFVIFAARKLVNDSMEEEDFKNA